MTSILSKAKQNNRPKIYGEIAIILVIIMYSLNYFNNTYPYSEGWFVNYVELVDRGMFPYKDFYYYLPPLNLLIDYIFWKLSFGYLIIFRAWYLLERIFLYLLVYKLLIKFFDTRKVAWVCCFSAVLCTADDFDFFGDYNQNVALLAVIISYLAVGFIQKEEVKEKLKQLFWAGIVIGTMLLVKQTIFAACILVFFFLLSFFCFVQKDKNYLKYIGITAIGVFIPISICAIILIANHSLQQCLDQLFLSVEGKGSAYDILITYLLITLKNWKAWGVAVLLFLLFWFSGIRKINVNKKIFYSSLGLLIIGICLYKYTWLQTAYYFLVEFTKISAVFALTLVPTIGLLFFYYAKKKPYDNGKIFYTLAVAVVIQCGIVMFTPSLYHAIYNVGIYRSLFTYFHSVFYYFLIITFCVLLIYTVQKKEIIKFQKELIMIAGGGLALNYATAMAAGLETIASNSMRLTLPLALSLLFSAIDLNKTKQISFSKSKSIPNRNMLGSVLAIGISCCCVLGVMTCIAQKSITAYPWWGMKDCPKEEKTFVVNNVPALKGIRFSEQDKYMHENIISLIEENTDEDDIIFGYPYIKIYNILCNRYNTYSVPVFWFDVVGDKYVDILIEELNEKLPDIVIWYDIPNALETHEAIYRNGKPLKQRQIVDMFNKLLPKKYESLGEYNDMAVYKLKGTDKCDAD